MLSSQNINYPRVCGYELRETIGEGTFGKVKLAISFSGNPTVAAVKIIPKVPKSIPKSDVRAVQDHIQKLKKEVQLHRACVHDNIVRLFGTDEDDRYVFVLMEYAAGGELFDKIAPDIGMEEDLAHFYFKQLIMGVSHLHSKGIVHRDLKPENLLLDERGNLKITDFGLATCCKYQGKERMLTLACGTPPYVAPEVHTMKYRGFCVDIWSSGIILYTLLAGNTPWAEPTERDPEYLLFIQAQSASGVYQEPSYEPWCFFPSGALHLLVQILCVDPETRITMEQLVKNEWFCQNNDLFDEHGKSNNPEAIALRMMGKLQAAGEIDTVTAVPLVPQANSLLMMSYSQPEVWAGGNVSGGSEPKDQGQISYSQPVFEMQTGPNYVQSQTNGGKSSQKFMDFWPSERLTRFYSQFPIPVLHKTIAQLLEQFLVTYTSSESKRRVKFFTVDQRKCPLSGSIFIQDIHTLEESQRLKQTRDVFMDSDDDDDFADDAMFSLSVPYSQPEHRDLKMVTFQKSKGDPLQFKKFFKALINEMNDLIYYSKA